MNFRFSVVSTFSGCGGSSLGYKLAGGRVLLANDFDDHAAKTYQANFAETAFVHRNIGELSVDEILSTTGLCAGELDILDGSPPCQGFSTAGKRDLFDDRNYLFLEFVRILQGMRPKVMVMENVAGMVRGKHKVLFSEIHKRLTNSGYVVEARLLDASMLGVPQVRRRVIIIGVRNDLGIIPQFPNPILPMISVGVAFAGLPIDSSVTIKKSSIPIWARCRMGAAMSTVHPKGHWYNASKVDPFKPARTICALVDPGMTWGVGLYHWEHPRCLNLAELKRLSTFPDDFVFPGTFKKQWARIGDAVPPNMMAAIAETIASKILGLHKGSS